MTDNEPTGAPFGTPVQTEPVSTTPTGAAPGQGPTVPPAGRPPRRAGLVRWGIAIVTLAVTVGVVSIGVVLLAAGGGASSLEKWLPGDTVAYLEVRADLPGDQRAKVGGDPRQVPRVRRPGLARLEDRRGA